MFLQLKLFIYRENVPALNESLLLCSFELPVDFEIINLIFILKVEISI